MTSSVPGVSAEQLVRNLWPQTGPHSPGLTKGAAIAIYELVKFLTSATGAERTADSLPTPGDGYAVTTNLRAAADLQQQLYTQLAEWVEGLAFDPNLRQHRLPFDAAERPASTTRAREAGQAFRFASMHSAELSDSLTQALDELGPLYRQRNAD